MNYENVNEVVPFQLIFIYNVNQNMNKNLFFIL